jgi:hypothetical protein
VLTLLLKKNTYQNTWYLFQVTDGDGYPQVSTPLLQLHRVSGATSPAQIPSKLVIAGASLLHPSATLKANLSLSVSLIHHLNQLSSLSGPQFPLL